MKQHFMVSMMLLALSGACVIGQSFEAWAEGASAPDQLTAEQQSVRPPPNPYRNAYYGDLHVQGLEGIQFYTRQKVTLTRWFRPSGDSPEDSIWRGQP